MITDLKESVAIFKYSIKGIKNELGERMGESTQIEALFNSGVHSQLD